MSWIDQGRQRHGQFGHGTAPRADPGEFRARAFAAVHFAADAFPDRDRLPFPLDKTVEVLRFFAAVMAPEAGLAPDAFRLRFFRASFDPVDAWAIQAIMRDIEAADTHAGLVRSGQDLAAIIRAHGPEGWTRLLGTAVAHFAPTPPKAAADGDAGVQKAQFAIPAGPLPLPLAPAVIPGTPENRAVADAIIKWARQPGPTVGDLLENRRHDEDDEDEEKRRRPPRARPRPAQPAEAAGQDGETRDRPPPGSKPINETPWSGDHKAIKKGLDAGSTDKVNITPENDVWTENPDGSWKNRGSVENYVGSNKPAGRKGKDRVRWGS